MAIVRKILKKIALLLIRLYQLALSPYLGKSCRFYPSCSGYAYQAIEKYGVFKGGWLTTKRLLKCHPWHTGGVDLLP